MSFPCWLCTGPKRALHAGSQQTGKCVEGKCSSRSTRSALFTCCCGGSACVCSYRKADSSSTITASAPAAYVISVPSCALAPQSDSGTVSGFGAALQAFLMCLYALLTATVQSYHAAVLDVYALGCFSERTESVVSVGKPSVMQARCCCPCRLEGVLPKAHPDRQHAQGRTICPRLVRINGAKAMQPNVSAMTPVRVLCLHQSPLERPT